MNVPVARESIRSVAMEAALADLERALCRDRCHVVVSASTGPAKRLLLGALAERVAGSLRVIPLPAAEDGVDLYARILRELGEPCGEDAEASLVGVVRRLSSQGSALALVAGDARALPEPTLRLLGRLAARARPGLRLVLVSDGTGGSDRDAIAEFMAPLGIGAVKVVLDAPLHREPGSSCERPATFAPPRLPSTEMGGAPRTPEVRARRSATAGAPVRRTMRFALVGLGAAAFGFAVVNRIEIPRERSPEPPTRAKVAAPLPVDPPAAPDPAPAPAAAPIADVAAKPALPAPVPAVAPQATVPPQPEPEPEVASSAPGPAAPQAPAAVEAAVTVAAAEPQAVIAVSLNALPWAHIEIDGLDVGVTPMADVKLSEGPHRFRARFPDGRVIERTVRVDAVRDHITFP